MIHNDFCLFTSWLPISLSMLVVMSLPASRKFKEYVIYWHGMPNNRNTMIHFGMGTMGLYKLNWFFSVYTSHWIQKLNLGVKLKAHFKCSIGTGTMNICTAVLLSIMLQTDYVVSYSVLFIVRMLRSRLQWLKIRFIIRLIYYYALKFFCLPSLHAETQSSVCGYTKMRYLKM